MNSKQGVAIPGAKWLILNEDIKISSAVLRVIARKRAKKK